MKRDESSKEVRKRKRRKKGEKKKRRREGEGGEERQDTFSSRVISTSYIWTEGGEK